MKCRIISYMVPEGPPYYANGQVRAVSKCETHGWTFDGPCTEMCPLGRIDDATEKAIERIKLATV